jgi:hypothetical protein
MEMPLSRRVYKNVIAVTVENGVAAAVKKRASGK